jgi:hypothetical protein
MAKPISEQLADLSARAKEAEETVAATRTQGAASVQKRADEIRAAATQHEEAMRWQASDAQAGVASAWSGLTSRVQSDVDEIRAKVDVKKYEHDRDRAAKAADEADESASLAIDFAFYAVDNAETAVLDAVVARETAASY